jgi:hypothetical protein
MVLISDHQRKSAVKGFGCGSADAVPPWLGFWLWLCQAVVKALVFLGGLSVLCGEQVLFVALLRCGEFCRPGVLLAIELLLSLQSLPQ